MERPHPDGPTLGADLSPPTRLALLAVRSVVAGEHACPTFGRAFRRGCGEAGRQGAAAVTLLVRLIALHGKRRVSVSPPSAWRLTRDEQTFAAAFEAARAGHAAAVDAHLTWLLARSPPASAASALDLLAAALRGSEPPIVSACETDAAYHASTPAAAPAR